MTAAIALLLGVSHAFTVPLYREEGLATPVVKVAFKDGQTGWFAVELGTWSFLRRPFGELADNVETMPGRRIATFSPLHLEGEAIMAEANLILSADAPQVGPIELDGVLGADSFAGSAVELDLARGRLTVMPTGTMPRPENAVDLDENGLAHVELIVGETRLPAMLLPQQVPFPESEVHGRAQALAEVADFGLEAGRSGLPVKAGRLTGARVLIGGTELSGEGPLSWRAGDDAEAPLVVQAGAALWEGCRVQLDYKAHWIAASCDHKARKPTGLFKEMLAADVEHFGADAPDRLAARAQLHLLLGKRKRGEAELDAAAAAHPLDSWLAVVSARRRLARGDEAGALALLEPIEVEALSRAGGLDLLSGVYLNKGAAEEALALAERAVAALPEAGVTWATKGEALLALGRTTDAADAFGQAVQLDRTPWAYAERRARAAWLDHDLYGALARLRAAWLSEPNDATALLTYLELAKTVPEALDSLIAEVPGALSRYHTDQRSLEVQIVAARLQGHQDEAAELVARARVEECGELDRPLRLNCVGWMRALSGGDIDRARREVQRSIRIEPDNAMVLDTLGEIELGAGRLDQAEAAFLEAARLDPESLFYRWRVEQVRARRGS